MTSAQTFIVVAIVTVYFLASYIFYRMTEEDEGNAKFVGWNKWDSISCSLTIVLMAYLVIGFGLVVSGEWDRIWLDADGGGSLTLNLDQSPVPGFIPADQVMCPDGDTIDVSGEQDAANSCAADATKQAAFAAQEKKYADAQKKRDAEYCAYEVRMNVHMDRNEWDQCNYPVPRHDDNTSIDTTFPLEHYGGSGIIEHDAPPILYGPDGKIEKTVQGVDPNSLK